MVAINIFKNTHTDTRARTHTLYRHLVQGEHRQNSDGIGWGHSSQQKTYNISETGLDMTKVTIND